MMAMPSIADVKAAAEVVADATAWKIVDDRKLEVATHEWEAAKRLAEFALSVLNAPGMSDDIIENAENAAISCEEEAEVEAGAGDAECASLWSTDAKAIRRLIAEVLRLRAGVSG